MTTYPSDTPAEADEDLDPEQRRWLRLNDYASIDEWARDSDYHRDDACEDGIWIDQFGNEQDIVGALAGAIEAQSCEYEVTVSNIFTATDQADAVEQMVAWLQEHAGTAGYRWTRIGDRPSHNGQLLDAETGFLDAEDLR